MIGLIVTSLVVTSASLVLGTGILVACGRDRPTWLAGGVGYAALLVLATLAIRLPGAAAAALVVLGLALATAIWLARGIRPRAISGVDGVAVAALVLLVLSLPFIAAGHFGPLGVGLDDDLGFHVGWVQSLRSGHPPVGLPPFGYPTGGESLAGSLVWLAGGGEQSLLGVTAAAPILTALAALSLLRQAPRVVRIAGAGAVGVPYLVAAYFGEGSLKEVQMALMVLTFGALSYERLNRRPGRLGRRDAVPLGILSGGMFASFGTAGLLWPAAILTARAVPTGGWSRGRALAGRFARLAAGVALGAAVAALVYAGHSRFGTGAFSNAHWPGGNLVRPLPLTEAIGVWPSADFRLPAHPGWAAVLLCGIALVALVVALVVSVRQRLWLICVPAAACVGVCLLSRAVVTPYESAKALVIAGPIIVLTILVPLGRLAVGPPARPRMLGSALAGLIVAGSVLGTSAEALRNSPVDSPALGRQLEALRPQLVGHRVLFLGTDDWVTAELYGLDLYVPHPYASHLAYTPVRTWKGPKPPNDFDSVPAPFLGRVEYVITTRTTDASAPPANFSLIRSTANYLLWARRGPVAHRDILPEGPKPGAVLDCSTTLGRVVAAQTGVAAVRTAPVIASPWQVGPSAPAPMDNSGLAFLTPGSSATTTITLPAGRWALGVEYQSPGALAFAAGGSAGTLPGRLEPVGARWDMAIVTSNGSPVPVQVHVAPRPAPAIHPGALVGRVEAVPQGWSDVRTMPLRQACGRYVDSFQLGA